MFCSKCGEQCIWEDEKLNSFDTKTGRRHIYRNFKCPNDSCGHTGHSHDWKTYPTLNWFQRNILDNTQYYVCTKCGSKADEYDLRGGGW